jgi:hypothetical protein
MRYFLLLLLPLSLSAQQSPKPRFTSYNSLGMLSGDRTVHGLLQSVNGISFGPWFVGAGVGIDSYRYRTVPLFLDGRYLFGKGRNKWFLYADAGYHFSWVKKEDEVYTQDFRGGFYYDGGLGYQLNMTKKGWGMFFTAGFSEKWMEEDRLVIPFCPGGDCDPRYEYYDYRFRRYSLKVGWKF